MRRIASFPDSRVFGKQAVHEGLGQVVLPHTSFEPCGYFAELRPAATGTTVLDDLLEKLHSLSPGLLLRWRGFVEGQSDDGNTLADCENVSHVRAWRYTEEIMS